MTAAFQTLPDTLTYRRCYYVNQTAHVQVLRIANIPHWFFERVLFPHQQLVFQAPPTAQLEVYTGQPVSAMLCDRISCARLSLGS